MTPKQLSETAFAVDTGGGPVTLASRIDVLAVRWVVAAAEARAAYELWCGDPSAEGCSIYRGPPIAPTLPRTRSRRAGQRDGRTWRWKSYLSTTRPTSRRA
jgi:hypothetical protein